MWIDGDEPDLDLAVYDTSGQNPDLQIAYWPKYEWIPLGICNFDNIHIDSPGGSDGNVCG